MRRACSGRSFQIHIEGVAPSVSDRGCPSGAVAECRPEELPRIARYRAFRDLGDQFGKGSSGEHSGSAPGRIINTTALEPRRAWVGNPIRTQAMGHRRPETSTNYSPARLVHFGIPVRTQLEGEARWRDFAPG